MTAPVGEVDFASEALASFRQYGATANQRQIPDIVDGLKPGARRTLWAMYMMGARPGKKTFKAATCIGEVMGKYHPHGDCVAGTTRIAALDGTFPTIQEVYESGEKSRWVIGVDPETNDFVPVEAHSFRIGQYASKVYHVRLADGTTVSATSNHPFRTSDGGWIKAEELQPGIALYAARWISPWVANASNWVVGVDVEEREEPVPMYDFTVDGYENMLVVPDGQDIDGSFGLVTIHNSGIYTGMVTMAHVPDEGPSFKNLVPLIHGQGGWGDLDNEAGAPRYTECRLNEHAMALLGVDQKIVGAPEVEEDGVDMVPNFSGDHKEPIRLPALFPNYLVNGSEGMGLGRSTKSPAHNLREVMDLCIAMVDTNQPRWSTIRSILPGPDMACDADIFDGPEGNGIQDYMETGHGSFVMRARYHVEEYAISARKKGHQIVVTGLPFRVSPVMLVAGVNRMIYDEQLPQDIEVRNFTDANGTRVVIDIGGNDPDDVIQRLLYYGKKSRMQESFPVYARAMIDGKVETVGVLEVVRRWIEHRRSVVRRRSRFRRDKAAARLEIVFGFIKAVPLAEKIVTVVRSSKDRAEASSEMVSQWGFTPVQAQAILDMTIGQITRLGLDRYEKERDDLEAVISECNRILSEPSYLDRVIKREMREVRDTYGVERRCTINLTDSPLVDRPEAPAIEIPAVPGYLALTAQNFVRWVSKRSINRRLGSDHVVEFVRATDQNCLEVITNWGYHFRTRLDSIPTNKAVRADSLFKMEPGEVAVLANTSKSSSDARPDIVMVSESGRIKRIEFGVFASHRVGGKPYEVFPTPDSDPVKFAFFLGKGEDIAILTSYGRILCMDQEDVRAKGRGAQGIPAIRLEGDDDQVIWAGAVSDKTKLVYWTSEEKVGWFWPSDVAIGNRNTKGVPFTRSESYIEGVKAVASDAVGPNNVRADSILAWVTSDMEEPAQVVLEAPSEGLGLSDRQLRVVAPGINRAGAVWFPETLDL